MNLFTTTYQSPLGRLQIACSDSALCKLSFLNEPDVAPETIPNALTVQVAQQLDDYFSGSRKLFQIPMLQQGTLFQQKVWQLLEAIPYGKTVSYMDLSKTCGDVKAIRAVAAANGKNNLAIIIPCHRVIGSNQTLTGYAGGLWRKQWLLAHEAKYQLGVQQLF